MEFESLVRFKALSQRYHSANPQLTDHLLNQHADSAESLGLQKVQFLVTPVRKKDLQEVCQYLEMTQREYLDSMLADAIKKTWAVIEQEHATPEDLGYTVAQ